MRRLRSNGDLDGGLEPRLESIHGPRVVSRVFDTNWEAECKGWELRRHTQFWVVLHRAQVAAAKEEPAAAAPAAEEVTEHWEERADEAAEASSLGAGDANDKRHTYSRDYLLSIGSRILEPLPIALDSYFQQNILLEKPQDNTRIGVGLTLGRAGSREADWGRRDERNRSGDFRGGDMRGGDMRGGRDRDGMRGGQGGRGGGGMDRRGSGEQRKLILGGSRL